MKFAITAVSRWRDYEKILDDYPVLRDYKTWIEHPYKNKDISRVMIEVEDLSKLYEDLKTEIIIGADVCDKGTYQITIYDGYIE